MIFYEYPVAHLEIQKLRIYQRIKKEQKRETGGQGMVKIKDNEDSGILWEKKQRVTLGR